MEPQFQPQVVEPVVRRDGNYKKYLILAAVVILFSALTGVTVWYLMNKQITDNQAANATQVSVLQNQISSYKKTNTSLVAAATATKTASTSTTLTNDQIFNQVATQFGLTRSNITTFKIWGQDKVSYGLLTPPGVLFAYKESGQWQKTVPELAIAGCSVYASVPEQYKPVCAIEVNGVAGSDLAYQAGDGSSINYPQSAAVKYIGS
jgi:hypothetical protein